MKRLTRLLLMIPWMLAAVSLACVGESVCSELVVQSHVEAAKGELNLADLLSHGTCSRFQHAASQVSLGAAPQDGTVRVLDGRQVRQLLAGLGEDKSLGAGRRVRMKIPERIVVERAARTKSCAEIARFVASKVSQQDAAGAPRRWQNDLNCAGASAIPMDAVLELTKTVWNQGLQRREFDLRCAPAADCVPFLVWAREPKSTLDSYLPTVLQPSPRTYPQPGDAPQASAGDERLVKPGQTATLEWEQGGIRVVLPVTCIDAGGMGEFVRVRFKNAPGILRAEVVGDGRLRASL
jgi:hypothetical protein